MIKRIGMTLESDDYTDLTILVVDSDTVSVKQGDDELLISVDDVDDFCQALKEIAENAEIEE